LGFTHYLETRKEISQTKWDNEVIPGIGMLLQTAQRPPFNLKLANAFGESGTAPQFDADRIMFNGLEEDSHETMEIKRTVDDFYFCKTVRKPYDAACVAVLIFMETCFRTQFSWRSDGAHDNPDDPNEFKQDGLAILKATFDYEILDRKSLLRSLKEKLQQDDPALQGNPTT
jgi:hypothetical protein